MSIKESGENYLETILLLKQQNGSVRSIDVATALGFSKPSISRAMSILRENDYIVMHSNGQLELTEKGLATAQGVYERHRLLMQFLTEILGLDEQTADTDACRIEHIISNETFEAIKEYLRKSNTPNGL